MDDRLLLDEIDKLSNKSNKHSEKNYIIDSIKSNLRAIYNSSGNLGTTKELALKLFEILDKVNKEIPCDISQLDKINKELAGYIQHHQQQEQAQRNPEDVFTDIIQNLSNTTQQKERDAEAVISAANDIINNKNIKPKEKTDAEKEITAQTAIKEASRRQTQALTAFSEDIHDILQNLEPEQRAEYLEKINRYFNERNQDCLSQLTQERREKLEKLFPNNEYFSFAEFLEKTGFDSNNDIDKQIIQSFIDNIYTKFDTAILLPVPTKDGVENYYVVLITPNAKNDINEQNTDKQQMYLTIKRLERVATKFAASEKESGLKEFKNEVSDAYELKYISSSFEHRIVGILFENAKDVQNIKMFILDMYRRTKSGKADRNIKSLNELKELYKS